MELADIEREIKNALQKSLECPIEEDRLFWIKCMMYWQIQLEMHPDLEARDRKHDEFEKHIKNLATDIANRTDLIFNDIVYRQGVMYADFNHGIFECSVHCRDVEVIYHVLNSKLAKEEMEAQIKQILDTYAMSEERITDWYIP